LPVADAMAKSAGQTVPQDATAATPTPANPSTDVPAPAPANPTADASAPTPANPTADVPAPAPANPTADVPAPAPANPTVDVPAPDAVVTTAAGTYVVERGDNLWKIAKKVYGDGDRWIDIYNANSDVIKKDHIVYKGQVLRIPGAGGYAAQEENVIAPQPTVQENPAPATQADSQSGDTWKQEYIELAKQWQVNYGNNYYFGYDLIYLDADDIPELLMYCDGGFAYGMDIYTVADGKAVHLDRYGMDGTSEMSPEEPFTSNDRRRAEDAYMPRQGILLQNRDMITENLHWVDGYQLVNGKLNKIFTFSCEEKGDYVLDEETGQIVWDDDAYDTPVPYELNYKKQDGTIVNVKNESDIYFSIFGECPEARDIEAQYGISCAVQEELSPDVHPRMGLDGVIAYLAN